MAEILINTPVLSIKDVLPPQKIKANKEVTYAVAAVDLAYNTSNLEQYQEALSRINDNLVATGWEILITSSDKASTSKYAYKAITFINRETKEIHIASAGTKADINDLWDDALITLHYSPNKLSVAKEFVNEIINMIGEQEVSNYSFSTSGHSLGAIVADLTAVEILSKGNLNVTKSITFDSPGSVPAIKYAIDQDLFTGKVIATIEELAKYSMIYNAKPNFINTTNNQLGEINLVLPQEIIKEEHPIQGGWGSYLYNMFGSATQTVFWYLGVSSVIEGINNHKLKNFADLDRAITLPMDDWSHQMLDPDSESVQNLIKQNIPSTGKDLVLLNDHDMTDEGYLSYVDIDKYQWAYEDFYNMKAIGDINDNLHYS